MTTDIRPFPTFRQFFHKVHGELTYPYPWQEALQNHVMNDGWPTSIPVPTGLGKTAAITVWLYELARQIHHGTPRTAPMRLFYLVNRRVVIDQTHLYVNNLLATLQSESDEDLQPIREALTKVLPPGDDRILVAASIHGESPDDTAWMRTTGPVLVSLTPDQFVSRLLMRGYGVSTKTRSMHAGLVGVDRLVLFDEPHLSLPAITTIRDQERIQSQAEEPVLPVGKTVLLGATVPPAEPDETVTTLAFDLEQNLADPSARKRLEAEKLLTIDRLPSTSTAALVKAASGIVGNYWADGHRRILIALNTVGAAQAVFKKLSDSRGKFGNTAVRLLTSRFRPLDKRPEGLDAGPLILVATQTVEVGVDLSFDALVTEACSFDALSQRLGRLNRAGEVRNAQATLLASAKNPSQTTDAIYGAAQVEATLELLERQVAEPGPIDVSPRALLAMRATAADLPLESPRPRAATFHSGLVPIAAQTHPWIAADFPVAAFINGPDSEANRDVEVAWRGELEPLVVERSRGASPLNSEYVSVPLSQVRQFLTGTKTAATISDLPKQSSDPGKTGPLRDDARGGNVLVLNPGDKEWKHLQSINDILPESRLVFSHLLGGYTPKLGWDGKSKEPVTPVTLAALQAHLRAQDRQSRYRSPAWQFLPVTASLLAENDVGENAADLIKALLDISSTYFRGSQEGIVDEAVVADLVHAANALLANITEGRGVPADSSIAARVYDWGVLLPVSMKETTTDHINAPVLLADHSYQVSQWAAESARKVGLSDALVASVEQAGALHDLGKIDSTFQESLGVRPETDAPDGQIRAHQMLAKSVDQNYRIRNSNRFRATQPAPGWRHEAYSLQLSTLFELFDSKLVQHLIGAHHGRYRPGFLPPIHKGRSISVPAFTTHDMSHADDFLELNKKYGPWGLAYLETVVRVADWTSSASPQALSSGHLQIGESFSSSLDEIVGQARSIQDTSPKPKRSNGTDLRLTGLRDYPLVAWYASAGLLAAAEESGDTNPRVTWINEAGLDSMPPLTPVLMTSIPLDELVRAVHASPRWTTTEETLRHFECTPIDVKGQKIGPASKLREVLSQAEKTNNSILLGSLSDAARADKKQKVPLAIPAFANNSSYPQQAMETAEGGEESITTTAKSLFDPSSGHTISTRDGGFERGAEFAPLTNGREGYTARYLRTSLVALAFFGMTALGTVPPSGLGSTRDTLTLPLPEKPTSFAELRALVLTGNEKPNANWSAVDNQWLLVASRIYRESSKTSSWAVAPTLRSETERAAIQTD